MRRYNPRARGPALIVLHGWAAGSAFTAALASLLPEHPLLTVDLPGYGGSPPAPSEQIPDLLRACLPKGAFLMAWSLGTLYAIRACARHPAHFAGLITVCGSPRFPADRNWPGLAYGLLLKSRRHFTAARSARLVELFFGLQTRSRFNSGAVASFIRECWRAQPPVPYPVLKAGLDDLARLDCREDLAALTLPRLHLFGREDRIVPPAVAPALAGPLQYRIFAHSAHLPYVTEPEAFRRAVRDFVIGRAVSAPPPLKSDPAATVK